MKNIIKIAAVVMVLSGLIAPSVFAEVAVVVHPSNNNSLDKKAVRKIFLGKNKAFPNGLAVKTFDLPEGDQVRGEFRDKVLVKSESRLNAYWARMLFSSKAYPPKVLSSATEVKAEIARNPNAIAYIAVADVDDSVKVLFTMK